MFTNQVTVSGVTGFSPYYLLHGVEPLLLFDLIDATFMVEGFYSGMKTGELLALHIKQLLRHTADLEHSAEVLKIAQCESQEQFIRRFEHRLLKKDYNPGELVLF